tara:strand:+ start:785 stop:1201 length:417 start_codon:yes stop_codon:yes gene_type:complete
MALMYADGAMFLGNSKDTGEQSSLIGNTYFSFVSALATTNLATILANNATVLTTEITFLSTLAEIVGLVNNATVLTTEIHAKTLASDNIVSMLGARVFLILSITESLDDPAVKDVTPSLSIIDSTDTYIEPRTETEVI